MSLQIQALDEVCIDLSGVTDESSLTISLILMEGFWRTQSTVFAQLLKHILIKAEASGQIDMEMAIDRLYLVLDFENRRGLSLRAIKAALL